MSYGNIVCKLCLWNGPLVCIVTLYTFPWLSKLELSKTRHKHLPNNDSRHDRIRVLNFTLSISSICSSISNVSSLDSTRLRLLVKVSKATSSDFTWSSCNSRWHDTSKFCTPLGSILHIVLTSFCCCILISHLFVCCILFIGKCLGFKTTKDNLSFLHNLATFWWELFDFLFFTVLYSEDVV